MLEQIRLARHQHFGTRSERFDISQMALVFNEAEALLELAARVPGSQSLRRGDDGIAVPAHTRSRGGRRPLPGELPLVDVVHQLDAADCDCANHPSGLPKDVLTGFLDADSNALGRPVGVIKDSEGVLLVADDVGNIIWRVAPDTRAN